MIHFSFRFIKKYKSAIFLPYVFSKIVEYKLNDSMDDNIVVYMKK